MMKFELNSLFLNSNPSFSLQIPFRYGGGGGVIKCLTRSKTDTASLFSALTLIIFRNQLDNHYLNFMTFEI